MNILNELTELRRFVDLCHFVSFPETVDPAMNKHNKIVNDIRDKIDAIIKNLKEDV